MTHSQGIAPAISRFHIHIQHKKILPFPAPQPSTFHPTLHHYTIYLAAAEPQMHWKCTGGRFPLHSVIIFPPVPLD
jgi:hypothetical protein